MIDVIAIPLTNTQVLQVQAWLKEPAAELYRRVLASNIALLQAGAGRNLIEAKLEGNGQGQAAADDVDEALKYLHALSIFDEFHGGTGSLIDVTVTTQPPVRIAEIT